MTVAIDIGGTKIAVALADAESFAKSGSLMHVIKRPIPQPGRPSDVIPFAVDLVRQLQSESGNSSIESIGIAIGGPLDHKSGTVINFPHLPEFKDIPLRDMFSQLLSAPAFMDNDANLGAIAEHTFGAGRGCSDMVYITVSTGIGGGIIVGNRLVHGVRTSAGEIGHITVAPGGTLCPCGNYGCLEAMASGRAIAARAIALRDAPDGKELYANSQLHGVDYPLTAHDVQVAAQHADELAMKVWDQTAEYLALGIADIIHVLAPERIVLGGGVSLAGEFLLQPIRTKLRDHVFYVPIDDIQVVAAELGHDSALIGAALLAARRGDV